MMPNQGNNNRPNNNKNDNKLQQQARRDIFLANRPAMRGLGRERKQGLNEFADASAAANAAAGGYQDLLAPLGPQYTQATSGIAEQLTQNLAGLQGLIPGNLPPTEAAAAAGVFGQFGAGAMEGLASNAQRQLGSQTSATREGGLYNRAAQSNLTQDKGDFLQDLRGRRMDLRGAMAAQIQQRLDELKQQQLEKKLAMSDIKSNQATAQALIHMIGGSLRGR
jgi:hypothetical protein